MKEHPILLSGPMVRAILEGRKTQTRRVMKDQSEHGGAIAFNVRAAAFTYAEKNRYTGENVRIFCIKCPFGQVGDRLWVRETWAQCYQGGQLDGGKPCFRADVGIDGNATKIETTKVIQWKPSIFMPRWASRITLEVVGVRVERLWDISEDDAAAEGMTKELVAEVCGRAAGRVKMKYMRWLEYPTNGSSDEEWCEDCVTTAARKHKHAEIDGWDDYFESDNARWCEACGALLCHSLTRYGVETQLDLAESGWTEEEARSRMARGGEDALIIANLAGGIGDLSEAHLGRLNQIGFATAWNLLNAKRGFGWDVNPWVWVVEFKVI